MNWILSESFRLVEKLSTEIPTITRYADLVYRVRDKEGKQYIFNLEFQAQKSKEPMNLRMLGYNVRLLEQHKMPVYSTVIYITEEAYEEDQGYFKSVFLGEEVLNFRYKVIKLWELSASELLRNKIMGLYPLLGLTKLTEPKEDALNNIIKEIKSIEDPILSKDTLVAPFGRSPTIRAFVAKVDASLRFAF
ncbi:MAG: Rpn family recombination-promoting nuclease/putative transposase [Methanosarcinales archaeon]